MYTHAPAWYECPFCAAYHDPHSPAWERNRAGFVFEAGGVYCMLPTHYWGGTRGNCLIIPKTHYENIFDIDEQLGVDLLRATKRIALAMKRAFNCGGISTRQHNEPDGNQDVWHFHLHVFPRFAGDQLYTSPKIPYADEDRARLAGALRAALAQA